jgi:hypothetical protein
MNKNHMRGRCGGASWHNTAKPIGEAVEVNVAVVRRRTASLPGEISATRGRASDSAVRSNALGEGRESEQSGDSLRAKQCWQLSRSHSTGDVNRGAERSPLKLRNPQGRFRKDRTGSMVPPIHPSPAMTPTGGARHGDGPWAEKERPCDSAAVPKGEATHVRYPSG